MTRVSELQALRDELVSIADAIERGQLFVAYADIHNLISNVNRKLNVIGEED